MDNTITLPEALRKRMTVAAQSLHMDAEMLAIDALERFLDSLEDEARTRLAIAHYKTGEAHASPGETVFARYLERGVFTEEDLVEARAEVRAEIGLDAPSAVTG